jgi:hypothetical protein
VPEVLDATSKLGNRSARISFDEIVGAEILIEGAVFQHVLGGCQDRRRQAMAAFLGGRRALRRKNCACRYRSAPSLRSLTARWASGRRSNKCGRRRVASDRTVRSKGCLSNKTKTALAMIFKFKLAEAAKKSWRRLDAHNPKKLSVGERSKA